MQAIYASQWGNHYFDPSAWLEEVLPPTVDTSDVYER